MVRPYKLMKCDCQVVLFIPENAFFNSRLTQLWGEIKRPLNNVVTEVFDYNLTKNTTYLKTSIHCSNGFISFDTIKDFVEKATTLGSTQVKVYIKCLSSGRDVINTELPNKNWNFDFQNKRQTDDLKIEKLYFGPWIITTTSANKCLLFATFEGFLQPTGEMLLYFKEWFENRAEIKNIPS